MKVSVIVSTITALAATLVGAAPTELAPRAEDWDCAFGWTRFRCEHYNKGKNLSGSLCIYVENWGGDVIWQYKMCCKSNGRKLGGDGTQPNSFNFVGSCYWP